jgi:2-dehydro-3-deoxygalactonokinase
MTGELYAILIEHSMLGRMAAGDPAARAGDAFSRGAARGLGPGSLAHDIFGARTLALAGRLNEDEVADWLSGLLIGREIRAAREWATHAGADSGAVRIIGSNALAARYALALADAGILAETADPDAAARGLWRIALNAGVVEARSIHPESAH